MKKLIQILGLSAALGMASACNQSEKTLTVAHPGIMRMEEMLCIFDRTQIRPDYHFFQAENLKWNFARPAPYPAARQELPYATITRKGAYNHVTLHLRYDQVLAPCSTLLENSQ